MTYTVEGEELGIAKISRKPVESVFVENSSEAVEGIPRFDFSPRYSAIFEMNEG